jgi:hypothetical protein
MSTAGKGICSCILKTFPVKYLVLETQEFGKHFLLPRSVEALLIEVNQTPLISVNKELALKQVVAPLLDGHQYSEVLFLLCRETLVAGA